MDKQEKVFKLEKEEFSDSDDEKMMLKKELKNYDAAQGKASKNLWLQVTRAEWSTAADSARMAQVLWTKEADDSPDLVGDDKATPSTVNPLFAAMDKALFNPPIEEKSEKSEKSVGQSSAKPKNYHLKKDKTTYKSVANMADDLKSVRTKLITLLYEKKITGTIQTGHLSRGHRMFYLLLKVRASGAEYDDNFKVLKDAELWAPDFRVHHWKWKGANEVYKFKAFEP